MPSSGRKPRETDAGKQTVAPDGAVVGVGSVPCSRVLKLRFSHLAFVGQRPTSTHTFRIEFGRWPKWGRVFLLQGRRPWLC